MAKRSLEEDLTVSELKQASTASVHGALLQLSPIKTSRKNKDIKYFDAQISDGLKIARLVSFDSSLHSDMKKMKDNSETINVTNCKVKECHGAGVDSENVFSPFEIVVGTKSKLQNSPKKFKIDALPQLTTTKLITVSNINDISINQKVDIKVKPISVSPIEQIQSKSLSKQFTKQELIVGDITGSCRCVLWESLQNSMVVEKSYSVCNITVKSFTNYKYFSSNDDTTIAEIDDIGQLTNSSPDSLPSIFGQIVGVVCFDNYQSCLTCKAKVHAIKPTSAIGQCSKCGLKQKLASCQMNSSARVIIQEESSKEKVTLSIFNASIQKLTNTIISDDSTEDKLLCTDKMVFYYNRQTNIVTSINHP